MHGPNAGAWFPGAMNGAGCNAFMLSPQPPAGDPMWEGHDPSEGSVWGCDTDFANNGNTFFVPNGEGPTVVDPAVLAQRALGRMKLVSADARSLRGRTSTPTSTSITGCGCRPDSGKR